MDPSWRIEMEANLVQLLEPGHFEQYPVSGKSNDFLLALGQHIEHLQVYVGSIDEFAAQYQPDQVYF